MHIKIMRKKRNPNNLDLLIIAGRGLTQSNWKWKVEMGNSNMERGEVWPMSRRPRAIVIVISSRPRDLIELRNQPFDLSAGNYKWTDKYYIIESIK